MFEHVITLDRLGLIVSFVGAMCVTMAVDKMPDVMDQTDENGNEVRAAGVRSPCMLRVGFWMIVVGFLVSFLGTF